MVYFFLDLYAQRTLLVFVFMNILSLFGQQSIFTEMPLIEGKCVQSLSNFRHVHPDTNSYLHMLTFEGYICHL